ncbi:hypothetical protein D3C76_934500 [compost metagenome]
MALPRCNRQEPTKPDSPNTSGAQNPPWANGRSASAEGDPATRNIAPASNCTAQAVTRNVRDGRRSPTNKVANPANAQLIVVPGIKKNSGASRYRNPRPRQASTGNPWRSQGFICPGGALRN